QATLLGDRHRHTQVFRFDSALSPPDVPRPTSHGRRHPTDDRQMAERRGPSKTVSCAVRPRVVIFEMTLAECGRSSAADQKEASAQMRKTIATLPSTEFPNLTELRDAIVAETVQ